jgi:hypothetical protein
VQVAHLHAAPASFVLPDARGWRLRACAGPPKGPPTHGGVGERRRTEANAPDLTATRRLLVRDAARELGISEDAVRMRVKRGTLQADKAGGRLHVLLTADPTTEPTATRTDELIAELRDRVRSLDSQLDQEREANRENRRIIVALTSRIPELEAPSEARDAPEPAEETPEGAERRFTTEGAQEGVRRPW